MSQVEPGYRRPTVRYMHEVIALRLDGWSAAEIADARATDLQTVKRLECDAVRALLAAGMSLRKLALQLGHDVESLQAELDSQPPLVDLTHAQDSR